MNFDNLLWMLFSFFKLCNSKLCHGHEIGSRTPYPNKFPSSNFGRFLRDCRHFSQIFFHYFIFLYTDLTEQLTTCLNKSLVTYTDQMLILVLFFYIKCPCAVMSQGKKKNPCVEMYNRFCFLFFFNVNSSCDQMR